MTWIRIFIVCLLNSLLLSAYSQQEPFTLPIDSYMGQWKKNVDSLSKQWIIQNQSFYTNFTVANASPIPANILLVYDKLESSELMIKHPRTLEILQGYLMNTEKVSLAISYFNYYSPKFEKLLKERNLPTNLKYLPFALTAMNDKAINENGAGGVWQMMYSTALKHGLMVDSYIDERRDISKASIAALDEIAEIYTLYSDYGLSLLAYTCGPTNVSKAIRRSNYSREVLDIFEKLSSSGRDVLFALSASIILFEHLDQFQLKVPTGVYAFEIDSVEVSNRLHFSQIEAVLNIPIQKLRYLNPQYKLDIVPAINDLYYFNLPKGSLEAFNSLEDSIYSFKDSLLFSLSRSMVMVHPINPNKVNPSPIGVNDEGKPHYYTVKKGDNLAKIANKYKVSQKDLMQWNNIKSAKSLKAGKKLKIYSSVTKAKNNESSASQNATKAEARTNGSTTKIHTIKSGESLSSIGKKYGVTPAQIMKWNNISNPDKISAGQKLKIQN